LDIHLPSEVIENELFYLRFLNNSDEAQRIRMFFNRFHETVSIEIPLANQKDISPTNWNFLVREDLKPKNFRLPSWYLAYTLYEDDSLSPFSVSVSEGEPQMNQEDPPVAGAFP